jgi:hypothetical protein
MAFEIKGALYLDGSDFTANLRRASRETQSFSAAVGQQMGSVAATVKTQLAGAFGIHVVHQFARDLVQKMGEIKDASEQFEVTTDEVQQLGHVAEKSGLKFENFGNALLKLAEARDKAVLGEKELESFERFGVTLEKLRDPSLRAVDILKLLSDAIQNVNLTAIERSDLRDILGTKGERLLTALRELKTATPSLIDQKNINAVDALIKKVKLLKDGLMALASEPLGIAAELAVSGPLTTPPTAIPNLLIRKILRDSEPLDIPAPNPTGLFGAIESNMRDTEGSFADEREGKKLDLKKAQLELDQALYRLAFERLTPVQRQKQLEEEIAQLKKDATELEKSGSEADKIFAAQNRKIAAEKEMQLLQLQRKEKDGHKERFVTDALQKIGGVTSSAGLGDPGVQLEKDQLAVLRQIEKNTGRKVRTTGFA